MRRDTPWQEVAFLANELTRGKCMKKLLLLPLMAIGLALVPAKQADAQVSVGVGFGYPAYRYSYYGYPGYNGYYPRSYYHTTTAAIELTSITSIITTATKADGLV